MKDLNEDGATTVPAVMAPWAMKHSVGRPYTHRQDSSDGKKTTEQSFPSLQRNTLFLRSAPSAYLNRLLQSKGDKL